MSKNLERSESQWFTRKSIDGTSHAGREIALLLFSGAMAALSTLVVRRDTMKPITGSCLCGKVAFEVTGTPFKFLYCHCRSCQKSSGSVHAANLAFPGGSVRWTQGEDLIELFVDTKENPGFPRCFCRSCGSPLPKLSRNRQFWAVPSGLLDSDPGMKPQANIYWAEHAHWYVSADQIAKHEGAFVEPDSGGNR